MNSVGVNSENNLSIIGIFSDIVAMNSIFNE